MSAYGNPENYKLSYLETKLPKICKNTVGVAGENLLFYTEDGLYLYDGNKVEKCSFGLAEEIQSPTFASCADGKYFLCGVSKTLAKKVVFVYDAIYNAAYVIDVEANAVCVGDKVYAYSDSFEYSVQTGARYTITSGELDFSSRGTKVLKEVIIDGGRSVELQVSNSVNTSIVRGVRGK